MSARKPSGGGIGGVLLLCCAAAAAAGVAADFLSDADTPFWLGAEDGGAAALGAGAAAFVIVAGIVARVVLAPRATDAAKEKRHARPDA